MSCMQLWRILRECGNVLSRVLKDSENAPLHKCNIVETQYLDPSGPSPTQIVKHSDNRSPMQLLVTLHRSPP